MRIYKCLVSGDEMLCDNDRPLKEEDDIVYVVEGKYITVGGEDYGIAANADEDADEGAKGDGTADESAKVLDIVHQNRLSETSYDKKSYGAHIKGYMKTLMEKLQEKNPDRVDAFKSGAQKFVKSVLGGFDDYQFFMGPSMDAEGMTVLARWEGEQVFFLFFKDGLKGEKV